VEHGIRLSPLQYNLAGSTVASAVSRRIVASADGSIGMFVQERGSAKGALLQATLIATEDTGVLAFRGRWHRELLPLGGNGSW
jgi:hypothetical protein